MIEIAMCFVTALLSATTAFANETNLELRAQLDSYDLMLPKQDYCCSFRLRLGSTGQVDLELDVPGSGGVATKKRESFAASAERIADIRRAIETTHFFDLPLRIEPPTGLHPNYRTIEVRVGEKSHRVVLALDPTQSCENETTWGLMYDAKPEGLVSVPLSDEAKELIRRMCSVWRPIRALVTHPLMTLP
jgi:hypothetical protein